MAPPSGLVSCYRPWPWFGPVRLQGRPNEWETRPVHSPGGDDRSVAATRLGRLSPIPIIVGGWVDSGRGAISTSIASGTPRGGGKETSLRPAVCSPGQPRPYPSTYTHDQLSHEGRSANTDESGSPTIRKHPSIRPMPHSMRVGWPSAPNHRSPWFTVSPSSPTVPPTIRRVISIGLASAHRQPKSFVCR